VGTGRRGTKLHASVAGSRVTAFLATAAPWEPYFTDNPRTLHILGKTVGPVQLYLCVICKYLPFRGLGGGGSIHPKIEL
jgi:hypothetical protein